MHAVTVRLQDTVYSSAQVSVSSSLSSLLTVDGGLRTAARLAKVEVLEVAV